MQKAIDAWEGSLAATREAIKPEKLFAYPIVFSFKLLGEYIFQLVEEMDSLLTIRNYKGDREVLILVKSSIRRDTLDILLALDRS